MSIEVLSHRLYMMYARKDHYDSTEGYHIAGDKVFVCYEHEGKVVTKVTDDQQTWTDVSDQQNKE